MAFSFYQSLRTVPADLAEVTEGFRLSPWQKFWQLETPFAMPALIYNMMMSMSGGWFFVVAAEAITVGDTTIKLPGIGSYLATAIDAKDIKAVLAAVAMVLVVILLYDQLVFRPIVTWADKFKVELSAAQSTSKSWVLNVLARTFWVRRAAAPLEAAFEWVTSLRLDLPRFGAAARALAAGGAARVDIAWFVVIGLIAVYAAWQAILFIATTLSWGDVAPDHRPDARHHAARRRAADARQPRLGADRGLDRAPARHRRTRPARRPVPGRLSRPT